VAGPGAEAVTVQKLDSICSMPTTLLILYATVTGNAEACARTIADAARPIGYEPRVWSVDGFDVNQLASETAALFVVSTYGEGEPPHDAIEFWDELQAYPGSLANLSYGLYAIGDSTYVEFCGFGRKLDAELIAKGAQPIVERSENDIEYDSGLSAFCTSVFAVLPNVLAPALG
jgi:sulfite reductase alpha subunit-like flavoprotein